MKSLITRIEELHESMQAFLATVNEEGASAEDINESWALCERHSSLLEDLKREGPPADPETRKRMIVELERLAQLNAIITSAVERQQRELTERLERMSRMVRDLENLRKPARRDGRPRTGS